MRASLAIWTMSLCALTLGLGCIGWFLDPWYGEASGGNNLMLFLALPMLACVIALPAFDVPILLAFLAGGLAQLVACFILAAILRFTWRLIRG